MALIEVLVTTTIVAIGVLGLAQLQARTALAEVEAQQRTQALVLARDMADRLLANRSNAALYVADDYGIAVGTCDASTTVARDRCAWGAALSGVDERLGGAAVGGLRNGRGCVSQSTGGRYRVAVVWQGMLPTVAPATDCGRGSYAVDTHRRAVVVPIELPDLNAT